MLDDALRRLCVSLLDHPEGTETEELVLGLGKPEWLYREALGNALAEGLAEETLVQAFDLFLDGGPTGSREVAGVRPTAKTKAFVLGEPDDTEAGEGSVPSGSVNVRLGYLLDEDPSCKDMTSRELGSRLRCTHQAIEKTAMWKALMRQRDLEKMRRFD